MWSDNAELFTGLDEKTAIRVTQVLNDVGIHKKALTKYAYEDFRARNLTQYYDFLYGTLYSADSLRKRRFVNFGPGAFKHKYWTNADKLIEGKTWSETRGKGSTDHVDVAWDMYSRSPVNLDAGLFEVAYASHIIEHAWDDDVLFFFKDVHRVLKPGGVFRITAPNIDLGLRAARDSDFSYYAYPQFLRGGEDATRALGGESERFPIEYFVLEQCSLLLNKRNSYCIEPSECAAWLWQDGSVYDRLDLASRLSDRKLNHQLARHVNWFNPAKASGMLKEAGFQHVHLSGYGQSICPVLRDVRYFDNTQPSWSFYVDAVKSSDTSSG